ncbi:MAG: SGNH/GDSL hydrolase family protein [Dermatophilaceae bacterium]
MGVVLALGGCTGPEPSAPGPSAQAHAEDGTPATASGSRSTTVPIARSEGPAPLTGTDRPLRVVAFGDSVPSGSNCDCDPFPILVARDLGARTGRTSSAENLAFGGADSSDVLAQVNDPDVATSLASADLVLIEIGANDFDESLAGDPECLDPPTASCHGAVLADLRRTLTATVRLVQEQQRPADARVVLMGYWNVFRDGAVGRSRGATYVQGSAALTDAVNDLVAEVARSTNTVYADTLAPFKGPDGRADATFALAADGNHPNARGHELLAGAVSAALQAAGALGP